MNLNIFFFFFENRPYSEYACFGYNSKYYESGIFYICILYIGLTLSELFSKKVRVKKQPQVSLKTVNMYPC